MKLRLLALTAAAATALLASSANAAIVTISFNPLDWALNPGETDITQFQGGPTLATTTFSQPGDSLSGTAQLFTGSSNGVSAAPAVPSSASVYDASTGQDGTQYLSVQGGETATLSIGGAGLTEISFYAGSIDTYNTLQFEYTDGTFSSVLTGQGVADDTITQANGDQQSGNTNGRLTLTFDKPIESVIIGSGQNAFEISDIAGVVAGVPEPASWALMILGIGATGAALRTQRRRQLQAVCA
jgi:hypothetical protein